ncbi:hypothetical protein M422DRAFT_244864 [Sphaerobolus stellatus SS14]|nr:hypothetical protein M422DRAFT_244864 [Sphaerobolus stellatus SS14]
MASLDILDIPQKDGHEADYLDSSRCSPSIQKYRRTSRGNAAPRVAESRLIWAHLTSIACDQCRRTKTRCDAGPDRDTACQYCVLSGFDCTFSEPTQKRGPPKGYLAALENRLHEAEALLGAIISAEETRAKTLIADLSKDDLANAIIMRITNSVFGPRGRVALRTHAARGPSPQEDYSPGMTLKQPTDSRRQQMNSREVALRGTKGKHVFKSPSNAWQDHLCQFLTLHNSHICEAFASKCLGHSSTPQEHISSPGTPSTLAYPTPSDAPLEVNRLSTNNTGYYYQPETTQSDFLDVTLSQIKGPMEQPTPLSYNWLSTLSSLDSSQMHSMN